MDAVPPPRRPHDNNVRRRTRDYDKVGRAARGGSRCQTCRAGIDRGALQVGKDTYDPTFQWRHQYYHYACFKANHDESSLRFEDGRTVQEEIERQDLLRLQERAILEAREALFSDLDVLRRAFGRHFRVGRRLNRIFEIKTLKQLVIHMPSTEAQLLNIPGIGPHKCCLFGTEILRIIRQNRVKMQRRRRREARDNGHALVDEKEEEGPVEIMSVPIVVARWIEQNEARDQPRTLNCEAGVCPCPRGER